MRGGISYILRRHSKVDRDDNFIMYWDANNLYGLAMNQPLRYSESKFLSEKELSEFLLNSISENSPIRYILEVELEYFKELHNSKLSISTRKT